MLSACDLVTKKASDMTKQAVGETKEAQEEKQTEASEKIKDEIKKELKKERKEEQEQQKDQTQSDPVANEKTESEARDKQFEKELQAIGDNTRNIVRKVKFSGGNEYYVEIRRYLDHSEDIGEFDAALYVIFYDTDHRIVNYYKVYENRDKEDVAGLTKIMEFDFLPLDVAKKQIENHKENMEYEAKHQQEVRYDYFDLEPVGEYVVTMRMLYYEGSGLWTIGVNEREVLGMMEMDFFGY